MKSHSEILNGIVADGVLPLFYHDDVQVCIAVTKALYAAGIRNIEFTNRGARALVNFAALINERNQSMPGLLIGTGTIKNGDDANNFANAGADFLVSPFFDEAVADIASANELLYIPGCATPREIHLAEEAGLSFVKLFPGNILGPTFVKAVKPLFPHMQYMVTGGVENTTENLSSWFSAGVKVVGMGSNLISEALLKQSAYDSIENNTRTVLETIKSIRS